MESFQVILATVLMTSLSYSQTNDYSVVNNVTTFIIDSVDNKIMTSIESEYCTDSQKLTKTVFNIGEKVYIRTADNKLWLYGNTNRKVSDKHISIKDMFKGIQKFIIQF